MMRRGLAFIILIANNINLFDCAKESGSLGRIVRGQDAAIGQFPYAVRLSIKELTAYPACFACIPTETCGGALISPTWILTAAHCVADENDQLVKVYLGSISKRRAKVVHYVRNSKIRMHPQFDSHKGYNDIALIEIPYTTLRKEIGIIPLPKLGPSQPKYARAYATACGWGGKSQNGRLSRLLQWGRLQILPSEECEFMYIIETEICTIISPEFATINFGDSGSPLVLETTGELVGIASAGDARHCENGYPAIFTRVTSYLEWIKSVSGIYY